MGLDRRLPGSAAPVRGTQTFVGVMSSVWLRPSLTAIEIAWRWAFGGLLLAAFWWQAGAKSIDQWQQYQASAQIAWHGGFVFGFNPRVFLSHLWLWFALGSIWACVSAFGRLTVMRRLDPALQGRWNTLVVLAIFRVASLIALWALWFFAVSEIAAKNVYRPIVGGAEPAYVLGFAEVLGLSLILFMLWSVVSWLLQLAPVLAMAQDLNVSSSLLEAVRARTVRPKLIEINLVMGIVKLALIVLAMVFSASPLPFTSVATRTFLTCWWTGVVLLYFAMSDYFHVVRAAAYLRLWRAYKIPAER